VGQAARQRIDPYRRRPRTDGFVAVPFPASWSRKWSSSSCRGTNFSPGLNWFNDRVRPVGPVRESAYGHGDGVSYVVVGRSHIGSAYVLEKRASPSGTFRRAQFGVCSARIPSSAAVPRPRNTAHARERRVNRYYDPTTGQLLIIDPDLSATNQAYDYANDDPVNGNDPNGTWTEGLCIDANVKLLVGALGGSICAVESNGNQQVGIVLTGGAGFLVSLDAENGLTS
jgi:hypothetical protein